MRRIETKHNVYFISGASPSKRTRHEAGNVPVDPRNPYTKNVRSGDGEIFAIGLGKHGFENFQSEPVSIVSNLPKPSQAHCMDVRRFFMNEILQGNKRGIRPIPVVLKIPIAISKMNSVDSKWVTVKFAVDFNASTRNLVVGRSPVNVTLFLHKNDSMSSNPSTLELSYEDYETVVVQGRKMLNSFKEIDNQQHDTINDVTLPDFSIIRQSSERNDDNKPKTLVLLTASVLRRSQNPNDPNTGSPIVNIRLFAYDTKTAKYVSTMKGIGMGLRALYMLVFPCAFAIRKYHDACLSLKMIEEELFDKLQSKIDELEPFENSGWLPDNDPTSVHLDQDEKECIALDTELNDDPDMEISDSQAFEQDSFDAVQE